MSDDLIYGIRNDVDELLVARDSLAKRISELEKNGERDYLNIDANRDQINANLEGIGDCWKLLAKLKEQIIRAWGVIEHNKEECMENRIVKEVLQDHIKAHKFIADQGSVIKIMDKWIEHLNEALEKLDGKEYQTIESGKWYRRKNGKFELSPRQDSGGEQSVGGERAGCDETRHQTDSKQPEPIKIEDRVIGYVGKRKLIRRFFLKCSKQIKQSKLIWIEPSETDTMELIHKDDIKELISEFVKRLKTYDFLEGDDLEDEILYWEARSNERM